MGLRKLAGHHALQAFQDRRGHSAMTYALMGSVAAVFILSVYSNIARQIGWILDGVAR